MRSPVKRQRTRRPRNSLSREQIVEAALRIADQQGLEALSMPNIARSLECGVMTMYGYIDDKEDLLDAVALRGLADLRLPRPLPTQPAALPGPLRQPESAYAADWRRAFASLAPEDFPLTGSVLEDLSRVASDKQFEVGLTALAAGLAQGGGTRRHTRRHTRSSPSGGAPD